MIGEQPNMSRRNTSSNHRSPNVGYSRVPGNDEIYYSQFEKPEEKVPWRSLGLAALLFISGTILLTVGSMLLTGHIDAQYADRTWPLLIFGSLMFIPGAYYMHIACRAYFQHPGYSLEDIPQYE